MVAGRNDQIKKNLELYEAMVEITDKLGSGFQ